MHTLEEARTEMLQVITPLPIETIPLSQAGARVLAAKVQAKIDLPRFDNSAMDGYAVRAAEANTGAKLKCIGEVPAGSIFEGKLGTGECLRIFTGSLVPDGVNAVVMQEDTRTDSDLIEITDGVKPLEHIRLRGEDLKIGETIGQAGEPLHAGRLQLFGAAGVAEVAVHRQPVVGVLSTGDELREPGEALDESGIYESNRLALAALIHQAGAEPRVYPLVRDTLETTTEALQSAFAECDAVVTSGGVSVGEHDYVKAAFEQLDGVLDFWKVRIKPGKPFVFGRLKGKPLFGVPGNPVSAFVTFLLLVRPALLKMSGATNTELPTHPAVLTASLVNRSNRRNFMRVFVDAKGRAHPAGMQASHALGSLAKANALVDVPPESTLEEKATVSVLRWAL
jgi:molybdopterin molybdotransferase